MTRPEPFAATDVIVLYATTVVGLFLGLLAWWEASASVDPHDQFPWANVAVAALVVVGTGNAIWLLRARRVIGERRARLLGEGRHADRPATSTVMETIVTTGRLVAVAGATHYHRDDCALVAGKRVRAARDTAHRTAGRQPCDFCRP